MRSNYEKQMMVIMFLARLTRGHATLDVCEVVTIKMQINVWLDTVCDWTAYTFF